MKDYPRKLTAREALMARWGFCTMLFLTLFMLLIAVIPQFCHPTSIAQLFCVLGIIGALILLVWTSRELIVKMAWSMAQEKKRGRKICEKGQAIIDPQPDLFIISILLALTSIPAIFTDFPLAKFMGCVFLFTASLFWISGILVIWMWRRKA